MQSSLGSSGFLAGSLSVLTRPSGAIAAGPSLLVLLLVVVALSLLENNIGEVGEVNELQHILSLLVNLDLADIDGGVLRDVVHATLALLLLDLQGDAADGASLDALHQMLERKKRGISLMLVQLAINKLT